MSCLCVLGVSHTCTPPVSASSQHLLAKTHTLHFLWTLFWIRMLNQINSGIGRKAVCRESIHTLHSPLFGLLLALGEGLGKHTLRAFPVLSSPSQPSPSASPLCCLAPLTLSPGLRSTLKDTPFLRDGPGLGFPRRRHHCSALCHCRNLDYPSLHGVQVAG